MADLFHLCAPDFRGTILYPLNGLRNAYSDLYERERAKYVGRESVLDYVVPKLEVVWGDTVNLSALDPRLLLAERRRLGIPFSRLLQRRLVCIPVERVSAARAVRYDGTTHWRNSAPGDTRVPLVPPAHEFTPFDALRYEEVREIPSLHREYLLQQHARGEPALGFVFVPHVLVASSVDIAGLELVEMERL